MQLENQLEDEVFGSFILGINEFAIPARAIEDVINAPEHITPQPLAPDYLRGILTLRGMTVPVIDLRIMFELEPDENLSEKKVAILEYGNHHVGLLFDQTGEVFRRNHPKCQFAAYADAGDNGITAGAFRFDDGTRIVQLLNERAVIELNGVPLTRANEQSHYRQALAQTRGNKRQAISFRVNVVELALDISDIQEIILIDEIENNALANGLCIGTYNLRGQTIPLIDLSRTLGFEDSVDLEQLTGKRFLIARTQDQLFGLAVDEICNIIPYYDDDVLAFPVISVSKPELFMGCIQTTDQQEVFLVDIDQMLTSEEVREATRGYSELFSKPSDDGDSEEEIRRGSAETFLTFYIDKLYAISILDIIEVVDYPSELLQPPMLGGSFDGVLNLRGELVSIVNAQKLYGLEDTEQLNQQVIIFEHAGHRFGLAIRAIEAISHIYPSERQGLPKALLDQQSAITADVKEVIFRRVQERQEIEDLLILDINAVAERIVPTAAEHQVA